MTRCLGRLDESASSSLRTLGLREQEIGFLGPLEDMRMQDDGGWAGLHYAHLLGSVVTVCGTPISAFCPGLLLAPLPFSGSSSGLLVLF